MSDLYEGQFRRAEKARLRNKHEERRLKQEMERKHGMRETHEYRMRVMREERMLIEKELGRIRAGIRRVSVQPDTVDNSATVEVKSSRPIREGAEDKMQHSTATLARNRAASLKDVSEMFRKRRPDPAKSHVTSREMQPSVSELVESALVNAVMYAVKYGEKLHVSDDESDGDSDDGASVFTGGMMLVTKNKDEDEGSTDGLVDAEQQDMSRVISRTDSISTITDVIRQTNMARGNTSLSELSLGTHDPDMLNTPRLDRLDSNCSSRTSYSQTSSVMSTGTTPRRLDRYTRRRSTQLTSLTPRAGYKRLGGSVAGDTDITVSSLTPHTRRQTVNVIRPLMETQSPAMSRGDAGTSDH